MQEDQKFRASLGYRSLSQRRKLTRARGSLLPVCPEWLRPLRCWLNPL